MKSLVIGNTSQLSMYFDDTFEKISSRNIDFDHYKGKFYDRIYITFAEQRTFETSLSLSDFMDINYDYTKKVIRFFSQRCKKIIYFSTAELWNGYSGKIDISMPFYHKETPYILSKRKITEFLINDFYNVIIIYPVNFNSIYRKGDFLFSKVFDSIINKKNITIGNTYFYRDMVHAKYVAEKSILATDHEIVGSGRLTFVNDFIRLLYQSFDMDFDNYVTEVLCENDQNIFYLDSKDLKYDTLLIDTVEELRRSVWKYHL